MSLFLFLYLYVVVTQESVSQIVCHGNCSLLFFSYVFHGSGILLVRNIVFQVKVLVVDLVHWFYNDQNGVMIFCLSSFLRICQTQSAMPFLT